MSITSFGFLCFFAAVLVLYYVIPKKAQWGFLLLVSLVYFMTSAEVKDSGGWYLILYPMAATAAVYAAARLIDRTKEQKKKKAALICAVIFCVGLLCALKFWGLPLLAPMGISFYTLTLLGYLFDVYYEIGSVQKNYGKLLLFGCYFPTMISGPIIKYREMKEQMFEGHELDYRRVTFGLQRMIWGFFKKLVIAERMALIVNEVFQNYAQYSGFEIWFGAGAFTLQLYADFAGCMDIVLGISECFGIMLPENFNAPFLSRNISEFWRRWHMTLGTWLKEYLFYPLLRTKFFMNLPKQLKDRFGKKRAKQITTFSAMFLLWFVIGYWHGGALTYVIGVGLLQWFYMVSGELLEPVFKNWKQRLHINENGRGFVLFQRVRTFCLMTVGLLFFRSASVKDAFAMIGRGFSSFNPQIFVNGAVFELGLDWVEMTVALVSLLIFAWVSVQQQKGWMRERLEKMHIAVRWIILYALLFYVILLGQYGPGYSASEFIYQNFKV